MGPDYKVVLDVVISSIDKEGPLSARDFERPTARCGTWWDWKPAEAALEYHWRRGEVAISRRIGFEKVYDLTHHVLPKVHQHPATDLACARAAGVEMRSGRAILRGWHRRRGRRSMR